MTVQHAPMWVITRYRDGSEILKEVGPMGRFLFTISESPGLGIDAERIRSTMTAAPDLLNALQRIAKLTPEAANAHDARDFHMTVKAIADAAIAKAVQS